MHTNKAPQVRIRTVLLFACLGIVLTAAAYGQATAPAKSAAAASGTELKAGLGVEKMELTGAAESFDIAPDTKIYAWSRVRDVAAGSTVSIAFKKGDKEGFRKEFTIPSTPYRVNAYKTFRAGDDGDWDLIVAGPDGKELASTKIKVTIKK